MANKSMKQTELGQSTHKLSNNENLNELLNRVVEEVKGYADKLSDQIKELSEIGRALSGEYNLNHLLEMIVHHACGFTGADAGTLYIREGDVLRFKIVQNKSLGIQMGGVSGDPISFDPVELKESNVSAFVALKGVPVNIPDVYDTDLFDFTGPKNFDKSTNYRSRSMLVVPMKGHEGDIIGVLQLLNAKNSTTGEVIPFSPDYENLTESLASQAAIAITNVKLMNDMEKLFESFVEVMATAIDEKSPVTGGHIRRVAQLTMEMAYAINQQTSGKFKDNHFSPEKLHELRIAAWMHDIGKVTTPVEIIEKGKKLQTIHDRIELVDLRIRHATQLAKTNYLNEKISLLQKSADQSALQKLEKDNLDIIKNFEDIREFVLKCNEPSEFLKDDKIERLQEIRRVTYKDENGNDISLLTDDELENLSIRKGSITEKEREVMKNHAIITLEMLKKIPFTKKLKNIPHFAAAHHEFINGKGYPLGLKGDEIPFEGKLMAVTDIAEALTATDRPYKKAMPLENVYRILRAMASDEELDTDLVELFINENVYERFRKNNENDESNGKNSVTSPVMEEANQAS